MYPETSNLSKDGPFACGKVPLSNWNVSEKRGSPEETENYNALPPKASEIKIDKNLKHSKRREMIKDKEYVADEKLNISKMKKTFIGLQPLVVVASLQL